MSNASYPNIAMSICQGWTGIDTSKNCATGIPPCSNEGGRDLLPDWLGSWDACAPLMGLYGVSLKYDHDFASVFVVKDTIIQGCATRYFSKFDGDMDAAAREAIADAVFKYLSGSQLDGAEDFVLKSPEEQAVIMSKARDNIRVRDRGIFASRKATSGLFV